MKLFSRTYGEGETIIIAHGLYGSSDNWVSFARQLSDKYKVILLDLRNHGNSPHHPEHNYPALSNDLFTYVTSNGIQKFHLIGHSMGGRMAMHFAINYGSFLNKMMVLDVAPKSYNIHGSNDMEAKVHHDIIRALRSIPLQQISNRSEADDIMAEKLPHKPLRQFLLKNLTRDEHQQYTWKINIDAITANFTHIFDDVPKLSEGQNPPKTPTCFIKGGNSSYIKRSDMPAIQSLFPNSILEEIPNAGHWLHAEQPEALEKTIIQFLAE